MKTVIKPTKKQIHIVNAITVLALALFILTGIFLYLKPEPMEQEQHTQPPQTQQKQPETSSQKTYSPATVSFYAVGDNLIHGAIFRRAQLPDGTYDFTANYQHIKQTIQAADIAIINQETVINDYTPAAHYPTFSTPLEMLQTLIDTGFDVANIATNHMLDKGKNALINSLQHLEASPLITSGAFLGKEDRNKVRIVERSGIKFSFIGVTFGTNGIPIPEGEDLLINLISDEQTMQTQIEQAKEQSDFVIIMAHWGTEYSNKQDENQEIYAQKLADWGADLIIGHHPHVIQPVDYITSTDGRKVYVAYSLGNFISAQDTVKSLTGAGLSFNVSRHEDGTFTVDDLYVEPLVTHAESDSYYNIRVYRLTDYTSSLAKQHTLYKEGWNIQNIANYFKTVMGEYARIVHTELDI